MSDIDSKQIQSQTALAAALRQLARAASPSAPPELATGLAVAFRRHHSRRRIIRSAAGGVILLGLAAAVVLIAANHRTRPGLRAERQPAPGGPASVSVSVPTERSVEGALEQMIHKPQVAERAASARQVRADRQSTAGAGPGPTRSTGTQEKFVALPSFAFRMPGEELRIIRVSMPVSSLRLLGIQVHGEFSTRRITTDLVIGADGTPYAFRPVT